MLRSLLSRRSMLRPYFTAVPAQWHTRLGI
jgi:hypothetical protein